MATDPICLLRICEHVISAPTVNRNRRSFAALRVTGGNGKSGRALRVAHICQNRADMGHGGFKVQVQRD